MAEKIKGAQVVLPDTFDPEEHFYDRVRNTNLHPIVHNFVTLGNDRIARRYCHLNPKVKYEDAIALLEYKPQYFKWAGADLFNVVTAMGNRKMVLIETNSCPSGQKSMPTADGAETIGYHRLMNDTFIQFDLSTDMQFAIIYDKNYMEASGYAAVLADIVSKPVYLAKFEKNDPNPPVRMQDGWVEVLAEGKWIRVDAVFRYVTQAPWTRFPMCSKTKIMNPIVCCLSGGRNKMMASKAYEFFNAENHDTGIQLLVPETINDVNKAEVPLWVERFGGFAAVKNPYSNAGQGVYVITSKSDLDNFMNEEHTYSKFIVQSLIGNSEWSSNTQKGRLYHVGTVPNKKKNIFVADIRMMVHATGKGFRPLAIYSRRARNPLPDKLNDGIDSWNILGTNLSIKNEDGSWDSDTKRLIAMDSKDFNKLGIGIDDLIDGYVQTVCAVIAIDKMSQRLMNEDGFNIQLFQSLNDDPKLIDEINLEI